MIVLGIDPGNSYSGFAMLDGEELLALASFPTTGGVWRASQSKVVPFLAALPTPDRVLVEHAPPKTRDPKKKKAQAVIGWGQGYASGVLASVANAREDPYLVEVTPWRQAMQVDAAKHRLLLQPPKRLSSEQMRAWWKKAAYTWASRRWPEAVQTVVDAARSRARTPKADHELAGVSDACEAAGIAICKVRR